MTSTRWMRAAAVAPLLAVVVSAPAQAEPARAGAKPDPGQLRATGQRLVATPPVRGVRPATALPISRATSANLKHSCYPLALVVGGSLTCTVTVENTGPTAAAVELGSAFGPELAVVEASGAAVTTPRAVQASRTTLAPATAAGPSSVAPDPGTVIGYVPLSTFTGTTVRGIGDEETTELNVPAFVYDGTTYGKIGVSSNGYLVAGGGAAADVGPNGHLPHAVRPNNVIAPFWTDLDGTGATGVLANVLTDGVSRWIVVEWQVNAKGTRSRKVFQTWIGVNGTQDIQFAYKLDTIAGPVRSLTVGAENADGTVGVRLPAGTVPTGDLRLTSADRRPGGALSYTVTLKAVRESMAAMVTSTARVQGLKRPLTTSLSANIASAP
ncbi:hypothetical protein [Actinoplanes sp. HUAS TT8]|uniref:hypothetical protein n=1 Tax=Actinoplanes sp. HUAS TT8 TaxID=3447453 RepID=UPI003F51BB25